MFNDIKGSGIVQQEIYSLLFCFNQFTMILKSWVDLLHSYLFLWLNNAGTRLKILFIDLKPINSSKQYYSFQ